MTTLTPTMATTTTIEMDDDVDDTGQDNDADNDVDDAGNDASSMMSDEGDNPSTAMMHAHWGRQQHWQRILSCGRGQGNEIIPSFICC